MRRMGGAKKGHSFFGNQWVKFAKYRRGRKARRTERRRVNPRSIDFDVAVVDSSKKRGWGYETVRLKSRRRSGLALVAGGLAVGATGVGLPIGALMAYSGVQRSRTYTGRSKKPTLALAKLGIANRRVAVDSSSIRNALSKNKNWSPVKRRRGRS